MRIRATTPYTDTRNVKPISSVASSVKTYINFLVKYNISVNALFNADLDDNSAT